MSDGAPLSDVRIVEFAGLGPGPFATMLLADLGADAITITRPGSGRRDPRFFAARGRPAVELDLKSSQDVATALALIARADVLIEGFRPGTMERLGLGPEIAMQRNPRLIYGRITGWGQAGPLATAAGHDINFLAITGALDAIRGKDGKPVAPINLLGDYAGGSLYLVMALLAALHERQRSGAGQVIDAAIVDGVISLLTGTASLKARGQWSNQPGTNLLDGGAFFYQTYECSDGRWLAVGAAEPAFYRLFRQCADLTDPAFDAQMDRSQWPALHDRLKEILRSRTREEWLQRFAGHDDACVTPILSFDEAPWHPHLQMRGSFTEHGGYRQPAPAPRFSRTSLSIRTLHSPEPLSSAAALARWPA